MKKNILLFLFMLVCITGFSQVRYDNGAITDNGTIGEYTIQGNLWDHKIITYYFQNVTNDFNQAQAKETVREAFRTWQAQAHIFPDLFLLVRWV